MNLVIHGVRPTYNESSKASMAVQSLKFAATMVGALGREGVRGGDRHIASSSPSFVHPHNGIPAHQVAMHSCACYNYSSSYA
jgi:hypothetical protein